MVVELPGGKYGRWRRVGGKDASQVLAVHAALLRTGKILYFAGDEHDQTQHDQGNIDHTRLFDCNTFQVTQIPSPTTDVFCSGHAFLDDGQLLVAGGTESFTGSGDHPHYTGLRDTWLFDPATGTWTKATPMREQPKQPDKNKGGGRWYPTLVTLPDGRILAMSGHFSSSDDRKEHANNSPEIVNFRSPSAPAGVWNFVRPDDPNDWKHELPHYPRLHVLPVGDIFCSTPLNGDKDNYRFNHSTGNWSHVCKGPADPARTVIYCGYHGTSVMLPLLP